MGQNKAENLFVLRTLGDTPSIWHFSLGEASMLFGVNFLGILGFSSSLFFGFMVSIGFLLFSKLILSKLNSQKLWGMLYWNLPLWLLPFKKKERNRGGLPYSFIRKFLR